MKKFYYYARLNDNQVCIEIVSRVTKLVDVVGYVEIPEYNETLRYKKWLGNQWSAETYEPSIDTVLQDKIEGFEQIVNIQNATISNLSIGNSELLVQTNDLQGAIMELTMAISMMMPEGGI